MPRRALFLGALILSGSCNKAESDDGFGGALSAAANTKTPTTGFSADMAKELGVGSGAAGDPSKPGAKAGAKADPGKAEPKGSTVAPSGGKASDVKAGMEPKGGAVASDSKTSDKASASDGKAGAEPKGGAVASDSKASAGKASDKASASDGKAGAEPKGSTVAPSGGKASDSKASAADDKASAGKASDKAADDAKTASAGAAGPDATSAAAIPPARGSVKLPAELAAIKLSLLPNWDRDVDQAGTFQYVVRIKGTQSTKTFLFHYGYDDPRAPAEPAQYKKYLQDSGAMGGEIKDRQRGGAWFLEGNDATGMPAFRYVVLYGGKRLICYGSQYKDAESNRLGDDRDQTLIQAKQICETLAL